MIANATELKVALRSLALLEQALQALRRQLGTANPELLGVTARTYERRIEALQKEIADYLYGHPSDVSLLLPLMEVAEAAA